MIAQSLIVTRKEILDHLRDRRSLMIGALYALMGPLIVMAVSFSGQAGCKPALLLDMMSVFALVCVFTGGMAVAMDITAGERERRSLLPLLLTPIARRDIVLGKWLATCAFALGALAINIAGVGIGFGRSAPRSSLYVLILAFDLVWIYHYRMETRPIAAWAFLTSGRMLVVWGVTAMLAAAALWYRRRLHGELRNLLTLQRELGHSEAMGADHA